MSETIRPPGDEQTTTEYGTRLIIEERNHGGWIDVDRSDLVPVEP